MSAKPMVAKQPRGRHSTPIRGLETAAGSELFQGRFGRMFRSLAPASFGDTPKENEDALKKLGDAMSNAFDEPKDGRDDEESGIPALYTYFGQFIDHDLTFDPASSLQKQNDPDALTDYRSPAFDLDNVYGRGPDDQPYMYDGGNGFLLGHPLTGGDRKATDLPRNEAHPHRALIGDPRNDENTIVSQLQGLFHRFHNRTLADNPGLAFEDVQRLVRFHYQYVILNDFLPRIIHPRVLRDLKTDGYFDQHKLKFFHWKHEPFMPVEFSVAAYRLGHSMIRPGYRLNDNKDTLLPIFPVPSKGLHDGLTGFRAVKTDRAIDWGRFIDVDLRAYDGPMAVKKKRLQFAYRIDTSLVNPLHALPHSVASKPSSLAERNLLRAWRLGLPSGQSVAVSMCIKPLKDEDILIGQGLKNLKPRPGNILGVDKIFAGNCPLWTYILAEAMLHQKNEPIPVAGKEIKISTPQLGPVGGRIVLEVFLGLMFGDSNSLLSLNPQWIPESGAKYALKDFVNYALGK